MIVATTRMGLNICGAGFLVSDLDLVPPATPIHEGLIIYNVPVAVASQTICGIIYVSNPTQSYAQTTHPNQEARGNQGDYRSKTIEDCVHTGDSQTLGVLYCIALRQRHKERIRTCEADKRAYE